MKTKVLIGLLIIGIVFISGCVQEEVPPVEEKECEVSDDCPDKICFSKGCVDYKCSYLETVPCCGNEICELGETFENCAYVNFPVCPKNYPDCINPPEGYTIYTNRDCPNCNDRDKCTEDSFDYEKQICVNSEMIPCCGNGECEPGETYLTCLEDCLKTDEDELEEIIPEIKEYPKLGQVFIDLYAGGGFKEEEIDFMKVGLKIYKENPKLKDYPKEVLLYQMSRAGGLNFYNAEFFDETLIPLAEEITAGTNNDLEAVKAIHVWVYILMTYKVSDYPYITPENILEGKHGRCGEYSVMVMALSKAAGIPARFVHTDKLIHVELGHAWVEAYIDGDWIAVASTGALDYPRTGDGLLDGIIEYSDLKNKGNNRIVDVYIKSPYYESDKGQMDITFGYNNYIVPQMITEVEDMLKENPDSEAENHLESAKNTFALWEKEKSTEERHRIGRESMEHLLRATAILKENVTGSEVQVAFLGDFPVIKHVYTKEKKVTPVVLNSGTQSEDLNPFTFWDDFQNTLIETNPKVLYLFDAANEDNVSIGFVSKCSGVDFCMLRKIEELIKKEGLDTKLQFILYLNSAEKIEFLEYEDIEPVLTLTKLFHENALDFMLNFNGAIIDVRDNGGKKNFYLPQKFEERYTYHITADGPYLYEDEEHEEFLGYSSSFRMIIETNIGELPLTLEISGDPAPALIVIEKGIGELEIIEAPETEDGYPEFTNIIFVDESGNINRPEEKNGEYYYPECPSEFVHLDPGQNLIIEQQGDFIKITETGRA